MIHHVYTPCHGNFPWESHWALQVSHGISEERGVVEMVIFGLGLDNCKAGAHLAMTADDSKHEDEDNNYYNSMKFIEAESIMCKYIFHIVLCKFSCT